MVWSIRISSPFCTTLGIHGRSPNFSIPSYVFHLLRVTIQLCRQYLFFTKEAHLKHCINCKGGIVHESTSPRKGLFKCFPYAIHSHCLFLATSRHELWVSLKRQQTERSPSCQRKAGVERLIGRLMINSGRTTGRVGVMRKLPNKSETHSTQPHGRQSCGDHGKWGHSWRDFRRHGV